MKIDGVLSYMYLLGVQKQFDTSQFVKPQNVSWSFVVPLRVLSQKI